MINFEVLNKDTKFRNSDMILDSYEEFLKIKPYLKKKIEGEWIISLVDIKISECRDLLDMQEVYDYQTIIIYLKKDVIDRLSMEYPKIIKKEKTNWETYLETIASCSKLIDPKASKELYRRCRGNKKVVEEKLEELIEISIDSETITLKHVNMVVLPDNSVYASDVLMTILCKGNRAIPSKGYGLSRYKKGNVYEMIDKMIEDLGEDKTFYAIRKRAEELYLNKCKLLNNEEVKETEAIMMINIHLITKVYLTFSLSNPKQLLSCIYVLMERGDSNVSSFTKTIISSRG